ncbi:hypothetical protein GGTG_14425 [Gaeumannomyces tritici R3-111a-1]|uniref:Uncharacterized protein n=1 Tax=Gaeumannomyces tritici (strain R3-111a-1) TaxID=644352 RepID=J3PLF6_GAET3|nr:hypothetical protein GGTG_14425 [Gaeumannomyces tritici R3-111a-1]EJT67998.1 hypothetical protein GGTG_14425 [Gaeumannomyces tritici R3-111a-1]
MVDSLVTELVSFYQGQWPCYRPAPPSGTKWHAYFGVDEIQCKVQDKFAVCIKGFVSADDIFGHHRPPQDSPLGPRPSLFLPEAANIVRESHEAAPARVKSLVQRIQAHAKSDFEMRYADDLERSAHALKGHLELSPVAPQSLDQVKQALQRHSSQCRSYRDALLQPPA